MTPRRRAHRICFVRSTIAFMKSFCVIIVIAAAIFGWNYLHRPIAYPPGQLVAGEPEQILLPADTPAFAYEQFRLKPLAVFSIDARVLHRKNYGYDRQAA